MHAVDTNLLVRALVRDDEAQTGAAEAVLTDQSVFIPVTVMLELEWVLRSRYGFTPDKLSQAFTLLCALPNVTVGESAAVRHAAARLAKGWDFADALHHALSEGCEGYLSFDDNLIKRATRSRPKATPLVRKP